MPGYMRPDCATTSVFGVFSVNTSRYHGSATRGPQPGTTQNKTNSVLVVPLRSSCGVYVVALAGAGGVRVVALADAGCASVVSRAGRGGGQTRKRPRKGYKS